MFGEDQLEVLLPRDVDVRLRLKEGRTWSVEPGGGAEAGFRVDSGMADHVIELK